MPSDVSARWLAAGKILVISPETKVRCPVCGRADLIVTDAMAGTVTERWMQCPSCNATNTLLNPKSK